MTPKDLAAIHERWEAATPGYWYWQYNGVQTEIASVPMPEDANRDVQTITYWDERDRANPPKDADLAFMAHAHQDVPALLNYIEHLHSRIEELRYDYDHNRRE